MLHQLDPTLLQQQQRQRQLQPQRQQQLKQSYNFQPHQSNPFGPFSPVFSSSSSLLSSSSPTILAVPDLGYDQGQRLQQLQLQQQQQQGVLAGRNSFSHQAYLADDMSGSMLAPPSPLLLNPTIVASQSSQQPKPSSSSMFYHQQLHQEQGLVHPHHQQQQQQQQQQLLQPQPQPQQLLHHHRSVMQLQQQYNNQASHGHGHCPEDESDHSRLSDAFSRKRSHSVPLLQQQLLQGTATSATPEEQGQSQGQGHGQGQEQSCGGNDVDQDMEGTEDDGVETITAMTSELMSEDTTQGRERQEPIIRTNGATVYDYSQLALPRESLLATLPRTHRHREYAASPHSDSPSNQQPHPHAVCYTLPTQSQLPQPPQQTALRYSRNNFSHYYQHHHRHHHHHGGGSGLYRENNYIRNRFPPFHHWPHSAQRDFHLATMGTLDMSGPSYNGPALNRSGLLSPASVLGTDAVLRSSLGPAGVNKGNTYKSRLPVHLRHMTSRTNRRAAICVNPFQSDQNVSQLQQQQQQQLQLQQRPPRPPQQRHPVNLLTPATSSSSTATSPLLTAALATATSSSSPSGSDLLDSISGVLSPRPLTPITTFNAANIAAAAALEAMSGRKRVPSAHGHDLDENDPRRRIMRLNQGGGTVYSTGSSSLGLLGSSVGNSSSNNGSSTSSGSPSIRNRLWMNQRGGLVNLTHQLQGHTGAVSKSQGLEPGSQGRRVNGSGGHSGTVDRLVEEMNKWSV
ncbi:hypothetical protein BGZ83_009802 [Gryganskiella cystojenkinii]|nr:hypothetical protein BGZ83_009802 [Gryganskiella cystojenkinii]